VLWGDEALMLTRVRGGARLVHRVLRLASRGPFRARRFGARSFRIRQRSGPVEAGAPEVVGELQQAVARSASFREHISRNHTNWSVVPPRARVGRRACSRPAGGPAVSHCGDDRLCRLDEADPIEAWRRHIDALAGRRDYLNDRRYSALQYRGPGTDLTIGLPDGHVWVSARSVSRQGISFTANIPTEEVLGALQKRGVRSLIEGRVSVALALNAMISMTFARDGSLTSARIAVKGLRQLIETDPGAARLGEIALVPDNSPISQSGLLFYNTLFDENAASHIAVGSAYKFTLDGGEAMSGEAFGRAGGNQSATHVDFMIGSAALDVDGVRADGVVEPVMRRGDWAFEAG
jgi:aminopeptidase